MIGFANGMDEEFEDAAEGVTTKDNKYEADWNNIEPYAKLMAMVGTSLAKGKGKGKSESAEKKDEATAQ